MSSDEWLSSLSLVQEKISSLENSLPQSYTLAGRLAMDISPLCMSLLGNITPPKCLKQSARESSDSTCFEIPATSDLY